MRALRSIVLASGLVIATSAANAAVRVFVNLGPSEPPVYAAAYAPAGPGYTWVPAYYAYGQYYPGRWAAAHEWREHEYRENRGWDRDRYEHRDRDDHRDRDRFGR